MFLLYKMFEINPMTLCILFDFFLMQFKHLITLIYKNQNNIYIVSKLFLNIFITLKNISFYLLAYNNPLQL